MLSGFFRPLRFLFRFACFHASLPIPVLSFLRFLSPDYCFVSQALRSFRPPVSSSAVSLGFRFRFRLLGLSVLNFSVRFRPRIYYHHRNDLSTSILYHFRLLSCTLLHFLFLSAKFYFTDIPDGTQNGIRNFHKRPSTALYIFPVLPQRSLGKD